MTELSFLIDLLMNHKLQRATKEAIAQRIKEVETRLARQEAMLTKHDGHEEWLAMQEQSKKPKQAASTLALMKKHGENAEFPVEITPVPEPVEVIAQTPAAAAAMASRQQAIQEAISGKIPKGQDRPRKF